MSRLKEVQMFPEDFDGVVIGSPADWQYVTFIHHMNPTLSLR
jgi:hypothetical protein